MLKKKLLLISLITILSVAVFHCLALKYNWYWIFRWLDIPVHIVGGFWVSLTSLWISLKIKHIDSICGYRKKALLIMLISVFVVGISWEIFEVIFKINFLHDIGYWESSLKDIISGFIGGIISYLYFIQNKKTRHFIPDNKLKNNFSLNLEPKNNNV